MIAPGQQLFDFDKTALDEQVSWMIGVDEAGRGPLAGPVYAAAVAIHRDWYRNPFEDKILATANDSKKLPYLQREKIHDHLHQMAEQGKMFQIGIGIGTVEEIDAVNILEATKLAMTRALHSVQLKIWGQGISLVESDKSLFEFEECRRRDEFLHPKVWVDGKPLRNFPYWHEAWVKGDGKSLCIALSSVIAKVQRDACMLELHKQYPIYAWDRNKGYGTSDHCESLRNYGPCIHHRRSFIGKILNV